MTNQLAEESMTRQRRPAWRQRLVDAEGGIRNGLRADSTLLGFFFYAAGVLLTSLVLGLSRIEWAILLLSLGLAFSAELLHQMLKQLAVNSSEQLEAAICVGTSAVMTAHLTAVVVAGILLWPHFASLWP